MLYYKTELRGKIMEKLRVADLNLLIDYKYDTMKKQCPPYKADFEKPNLTINIPKEEIIRLQKENPLLSCDDVEYVYTGAAFYEALLHFQWFYAPLVVVL